jgi:hypothetical protein
MPRNRNYNFKDVDMLLASKTIVETLKSNLSDLSIARSNWNEEYTNQLATQIDNAIENYLGLDRKKELRDTTANLAAIQEPAMRDLSFIKTQIEVDFDGEAKEIIKTLGFDKNLRAVQNRDQEALIELLYSFKKGLNNKLREDIIAKGTAPELIDRIIAYADQMKQTNISQETLKETTKELSDEALQEFNNIYDQVIGICKIASSYYQFDTLKKDQFTFTKVVENMNAAKKVAETENA